MSGTWKLRLNAEMDQDAKTSKASDLKAKPKIDRCQDQGAAQGSGDSFMDSCGTGRDRVGRHTGHHPVGGGGEPTSRRTTSSQQPLGRSGERDTGGDHASEDDAGQNGELSGVAESLLASQADLDFEFVAEHETVTMTQKCKRLIRQFEKELGEVVCTA